MFWLVRLVCDFLTGLSGGGWVWALHHSPWSPARFQAQAPRRGAAGSSLRRAGSGMMGCAVVRPDEVNQRGATTPPVVARVMTCTTRDRPKFRVAVLISSPP